MLRVPLILLLLGAALPGHVQISDQPQTVRVELSSFKFTPSTLTLTRGMPYRLEFVNVSSGGHDFAAKEFFAASTVKPADRAKVAGGAVEVDRRGTVDVTLVPGRPGIYQVHCAHFMHSGFGMKGTIVVQ